MERRGVEIGEVESFSTKLKHCRLDKGIMVSFYGYQDGAIDSAKKSNIMLLIFRPSNKEDVEGLGKLDFEYLEEFEWTARLSFESPTRIISEEMKGIGSLSGIDIYDENETRIGNLYDIVSSLLEREILNRDKHSGETRIDWSSRQIYMHWDLEGNTQTMRVRALDVSYSLQMARFEFRPGLSDPSDWHILEDAIGDARQLIPRSKIEEIKRMYNTGLA